MHPVLRKLNQDISRVLEGLSPADLQFRSLSNPESWTIYQISQHLLLTYFSTSAAIENRLHKGQPTRSVASAEQWIARFIVLQLGWIPGRPKAPPEVDPAFSEFATTQTVDALLMEISASLDTLDSVLERAERYFGSVRCHPHFALGPMNIADWRRFHLIHGRHHIRQIAAIRRINLG